MDCYVCGAPVLPGRQVCAECAQDYSDYDIAAKRFLAAMLRSREVGRAHRNPDSR